MPSPSLRLAVVGAGAAGLVAARELRREGHSPVVFERAASVGGTWLYDAAPATSDPLAAGAAHSSLYASLRTNLPREVMGFLDFPFASSAAEAGGGGDTRRFPGHDEVLRYLEEFARRFDLYGLVRFGTEVVRVRRDGGGGASLSTTSTEGTRWAWPPWRGPGPPRCRHGLGGAAIMWSRLGGLDPHPCGRGGGIARPSR